MKRLFFDLETSPCLALIWRTGHRISVNADAIVQERAVICAAWKWDGDREVHVQGWHKGNDVKVLTRLSQAIAEADVICAHNLERFDLPWLKGRLLYHGLPPLPPVKTLDTLKLSRQTFNLNSHRLDYLDQFTGGPGKSHTQFKWWRDITLEHCEKTMAKMQRYCQRDVRRLEACFRKLSKHFPSVSHVGVVEGREKWTCPHCGADKNGHLRKGVTAKGTVQHHMHCCKCGKYYTIADRVFKQRQKAKGKA